MHRCNWPNCPHPGTFPAPVSPRNLAEKQYFCQIHIREFNKKWNGLNGFSEGEIYQMQDSTATWQRPTWNNGQLRGQAKAAAQSQTPFTNANDLYGFFQSRLAKELNGEPLGPIRRLPPDVKEACVVFNIEQPLPENQLKKQYISLVKQHHPDVNKSPDAAEHIKRINAAYKLLSLYTTS